MWVLNQSTHITEWGTCIRPSKSPFIWMGGLRKASKKGSDNIACEAYASSVSRHNLDPAALTDLVDALQESYCNNFPSALFVLGVHALHVHYELLVQLVGGVPVGVLYGQQLNGADRDTADDKVAHAILNAGRSAVEMIKMGATLRNAYDDEFPDVIAKVREVMPEVKTRVQRSYSWLITATLKVCQMCRA